MRALNAFTLAALDYGQEYVDRGGDRIGLQVYPAPDARDAPAVVVWPAMGVPARYYRLFAGELRDAGLAVFVADLRGTGASSPRPSRSSRYGYAELAADVGAVQEALGPRLGGRTSVLLGHSLGAHACLLHMALSGGAGATGLVLVATGLAYWRTYPGVRGFVTLAQTQGIGAAAALLGVWPGWGFGGRQARGVIHDWAYCARRGEYPSMSGVDPRAALAAMRSAVLAVSVEDDRYTPGPGLDHLCGRLVAAQVERVHYTTSEAGGPVDHFSWARAAGPLARRVARFVGQL